MTSALRLQPDLPEVHLAYGSHLYVAYRDYEGARFHLALAKRGLPNDPEAISLGAYIDRRQGNWEKAIEQFDETIKCDPASKSSLAALADTLIAARQIQAAGRVLDRLIGLLPDRPILKVEKTLTIYLETGNANDARLAIAALPTTVNDNRMLAFLRLSFAMSDRDFAQGKELIERMKNDGEDEAILSYSEIPVPIDCYLILFARLQSGQPNVETSFTETRKKLSQNVQESPGNAKLLSNLAVVDALLEKKRDAITEAKRAVEMAPISKDAVDGPGVLINLAVVYAWINELDLAFETLGPLTKTPGGIYYGPLKLDPLWNPLRKDRRFDKLLAKLAPKD